MALVFNGQTFEPSLGLDFKDSFDHFAIDFPKTKFGLGIGFGTQAIGNVKVIAASKKLPDLGDPDYSGPALLLPERSMISSGSAIFRVLT